MTLPDFPEFDVDPDDSPEPHTYQPSGYVQTSLFPAADEWAGAAIESPVLTARAVALLRAVNARRESLRKAARP